VRRPLEAEEAIQSPVDELGRIEVDFEAFVSLYHDCTRPLYAHVSKETTAAASAVAHHLRIMMQDT